MVLILTDRVTLFVPPTPTLRVSVCVCACTLGLKRILFELGTQAVRFLDSSVTVKCLLSEYVLLSEKILEDEL